MIFEQKTFIPIQGYTNYYICKETTEVLSTLSRRNTKEGTSKILKQVNNSKDPSNNYLIVTLVAEDGTRRNRPIHRLMCETFLENPENKAHVNHKDGDKLNNTLSNLEWATEKENSQHAVDLGLSSYGHLEKQVHQYTLSGNYLASFRSDAHAEEVTKVAKQNISKVTLGKRTQANGYQWSRVRTETIPAVTDKVVKEITMVSESLPNYSFKGNATSKVAEILGINRVTVGVKLKQTNTFTQNNYVVTRHYYD